MHLLRSVAIWPNLELKTQPKQLLGSLPLDIAFPEENLKVFLAEFSTLGYAVFPDNTINVLNANSHFQSWKFDPGFVLLAKVYRPS